MRDLTQNVGNVLTFQHQTCVDEIFKCTIFVGVRRNDNFLPVFHLLMPHDNAVEQQLSYENAVEQLKDFLGGYHSYLVGPWTSSGF